MLKAISSFGTDPEYLENLEMLRCDTPMTTRVTHPHENCTHVRLYSLSTTLLLYENLHRHKELHPVPFDETEYRLSSKSVSVSVVQELTEPHW
jgi:hypothetical protein